MCSYLPLTLDQAILSEQHIIATWISKHAWLYRTDALYYDYAVTQTANFNLLWKVTIMRFNPETKTYKLFSALNAGEKVSASVASKRFGIKNISAEVSRIRQAGFAVYANTRTAGNHVEVTEYEIGQPSRKLIAAGYKAMALGLV